MNIEKLDEFYREQYFIMHESVRENFAGFQTVFLKDYLSKLFAYFNVKNILDYGCGKGLQYFVDKLNISWGLNSVQLYDVGIPEYSLKPNKDKKFDAVLCLDVMEHLREEDLVYYISEIISYSNNLVVFSISCRPARKFLPNGENVHLTVKPITWWNEKISSVVLNEKFKQKIILLFETESNKDVKYMKQYYINLTEKDIEFAKKIVEPKN